jgi:hypothetical protein
LFHYGVGRRGVSNSHRLFAEVDGEAESSYTNGISKFSTDIALIGLVGDTFGVVRMRALRREDYDGALCIGVRKIVYLQVRR